MKRVLVVAAHSARVMAECAAREGFEVVALDLFGDHDTRRACTQWWPLGPAGTLQIDATHTLTALSQLAARGDVIGWVPGSGFEAQPELLAQGAAVLPLIGTAPEAVRRLRDVPQFFAALARLGVAHPPVSLGRPAPAQGWLRKDMRGTGGWQVHRCTEAADPREAAPAAAGVYHQRELPGQAMSVTFLAFRAGTVVLGLNQLLVQPVGAQPFVYAGVVGPVVLAPKVVDELTLWVQLLGQEFHLRGLCSLDFLWDGQQASVLEINPRPPASMALYTDRWVPGLMSAHLQACLGDDAPPRLDGLSTAQGLVPAGGQVRGTKLVYARHAIRLSEPAAARLQAWPQAHDLPEAAAPLAAGDPVCSLDAEGPDADAVTRQLQQADTDLWTTLETWT